MSKRTFGDFSDEETNRLLDLCHEGTRSDGTLSTNITSELGDIYLHFGGLCEDVVLDKNQAIVYTRSLYPLIKYSMREHLHESELVILYQRILSSSLAKWGATYTIDGYREVVALLECTEKVTQCLAIRIILMLTLPGSGYKANHTCIVEYCYKLIHQVCIKSSIKMYS